ncbi:DUF5753 domain-containing protein [Streptomyces oceani]|uniref:DUF5753 domain-containing protein n=1 Tax=Streptomyces oceani TaxID=1075402 RepID=UPI001FCD535D|nr:DUF5753 domain-containing protein [Streptomyces oceani]
MGAGYVPAIRDPDVLALCKLYGAEEHILDMLLRLARADRERRKAQGWWNDYPELRSQVEYVALEEVATPVRTHQLTVLPGLFQTPDHARALAVGCGTWEDPDEIERFVEARVARQDRLTSSDPIHVWAVIGEATLHQEVGDRDVLRDQLTHLLALTHRPTSSFRCCPSEPVRTPAWQARSTSSRSRSQERWTSYTSIRRPLPCGLESEKDSTRHSVIFDRVVRRALAQADSRALISRAIEGI